ncbi:MAG: hypothetical protein RML36_12850 [Anaerolineae bacterium]|nr:hypothetical protein [Anaerolineae bacterium]MDW8100361.1 hypothetical protein [Anaerolineae bacterium]
MKNFIVSILEPILSIFVIGYTLVGFIWGGYSGGVVRAFQDLANVGLFGGQPEFHFHVGWAFLGGIALFLLAAISSGAIFTLLAIKELLEEQIRLLREAERRQQARS